MTMAIEPTLFDCIPLGRLSGREPLSHREDPLTSYQAADQLVRSGRHKNIKKAVLEVLRAHDGSTSGELGRWLGQDWRLRRPPAARAGERRPGPQGYAANL
jgi:hypothetical protein